MTYPFPGMNPYLEHPSLWPDVHLEIIHAVRAVLTQALAPRYYVAVEERIYLTPGARDRAMGRPDISMLDTSHVAEAVATYTASGSPAYPMVVELPLPETIRERYLEIRDARHRVVTVVEILSPANKAAGSGRLQYEQKRRAVLASQTNLLEIDLLRGGEPMPMHPLPTGPLPTSHYRILVSRSYLRPHAHLYSFQVSDAIPVIPVPTLPEDQEPLLDLGLLLPEIHDQVRYDLRIDYAQDPPSPPFERAELEWIHEYLRRAGIR